LYAISRQQPLSELTRASINYIVSGGRLLLLSGTSVKTFAAADSAFFGEVGCSAPLVAVHSRNRFANVVMKCGHRYRSV
jgi:hypothetical protein